MSFPDLSEFLEHRTSSLVPAYDLCVKQDHKVLYRKYKGTLDLLKQIPIQGNEIYPMYSCSKIITVVAAMQLFEKGLFSLDDPLSRYIPEYTHMEIRSSDGCVHDAKTSITVKHLFTMCAGIDYGVNDPFMKEVRQRTGPTCPTLDVIRALAGRPLLFEPGTEYHYGLCHDVLAALVELLSGMRFSDYVKKNIFEPIGMKDSSYHITTEQRSRIPQQYINIDGKVVPGGWNEDRVIFGPEYDSGGAGVFSSVEDFSLLLDTLACNGIASNGNCILSPASICMIKTNQLTPAQATTFNKDVHIGYSYGLGVRTAVDPTAGNFASPIGEFGWSGAAGAYSLIDTDNRLSITYAQNVIGIDECAIHLPIRNNVYAAL